MNLKIGTTNTSHSIEFNTTNGVVAKINNNGNVLIGTTTDNGYKLDVAGDIRAGNMRVTGTLSVIGICSFSNNVGISGSLEVGSLGIYSVGVIHSDTGIYSNGYVSAKGQDTTSDMRYKCNIQPIKSSLEFINKIDIFAHDWNDGDSSRTISLSAQWLKDTEYNYLVHKRNDRLSVDYKGLFMLGLQAIKELKEEIEILKTKIK